ncbi:MAG: dihydrodipicolinate synthase family protein [Bryobacterales bacterium]|nr:dihydrodipicolinate synthase family protein [Bryobacterales bacterium]MEB2362480.1 dihydrodipicolinate synthase family protein [Bryobacterales bacterium]
MLQLNGITPVMCTTFREDHSIDEESLRRQIDFAISAGAAAVCGPGFASEFYKLNDGERYRFAEVLVQHTRGRVPVIVATSAGSTRTTIEFSRFAEELGADCLMVTPPRTSALPANALIGYYSAVCEAVHIPLMLQDADFTGAGLPAKVFLDLAGKYPNFRFAKLEVVLPGAKCAEIVNKSAGRVGVIYGLGGIAMMDGFAHGATAMMPGAAALEAYVRIYNLYKQGQQEQAKALFYRLVPYLTFALQHLELAISIEKQVLMRRGVISSDRMRPPTLELDAAYIDQKAELAGNIIALSEECRVVAAA